MTSQLASLNADFLQHEHRVRLMLRGFTSRQARLPEVPAPKRTAFQAVHADRRELLIAWVLGRGLPWTDSEAAAALRLPGKKEARHLREAIAKRRGFRLVRHSAAKGNRPAYWMLFQDGR